jgi:cardiolipin synthase A/B
MILSDRFKFELERTKTGLLRSGAYFFEVLEKLIDESTSEIHFQTYILETDETGLRIADALMRAADRGVKIYLLLDAFASSNLLKKKSQELRKHGVDLKFYGPLFRNWHFHIGRRFHRKIIVIDYKFAIVGGINISNNYNQRGWLDFAVFMEGDIAKRLHNICLQRWVKKSFRKLPKEYFIKEKESGSSPIRIRQNDYLRGLNEAAATYRKEIKHAQSSLMIVGGYFLPGGRMRRALKNAVQRGVQVKVILARESDSKIANLSIQYLYHWFIRNKILIFEYIPSNVHGKVLIADKKMVSIGSYDLNNLSTYSNIELNLDIYDEQFASGFHELLDKIIAEDCQLITVEELYKRANILKRFQYWLAYRASKTLFGLSFMLANKQDEDSYE